MELTVVGSGTVVPSAERVCSSYFVDAGDARVLLDCGPGTVHHLARFGLPWSRLTHVVVSHFHTDHVGDLPMLLFALKHGLRPRREGPLELVGPPGFRALVGRLAQAFGPYVLDPGFPLRVVEAPAGSPAAFPDAPVAETTLLEDDAGLWTAPGRELAPGLRLRCARTPHTDRSVAWRLDGGRSIGYTGDTGYADDVADFLTGVDLLVAECSLPDEEALDTHLTPSRAARLASRAEPGRLLLTHVYPQLAGRDLPALVRAAGWEGDVAVATDGLRVAP